MSANMELNSSGTLEAMQLVIHSTRDQLCHSVFCRIFFITSHHVCSLLQFHRCLMLNGHDWQASLDLDLVTLKGN